ncbi:MAG: T9SS type A sorting domain-containing protein, partial [bacterium]
DVYFEIDSLGTPIYSETANITRDPGMDTTITWPAWTTGPIDGITYDITAYTVLSGDENPINDTLTATTTTQSIYWKTYATMPQASYYNAAVYSDVTGAQTVWSVGGNPTYTSIFEFDCATESWSTSSAVLNHEAQRTAAAVCMGKVYVMGGCNSGFTAHNYAQEFDPVAGTVIDVTPLPTARYFNGALTWNDTLIYVIGGQASSYYSIVEIYDPANDAWTTGTAMPITNRSFSCGIQNDTIYVAGGYNSSGYVSGSWTGVIDPANPQTITWSAIANIPNGPSATPGRSRLQGACVETPAGWRYYFTCGDDHGVAAYDTWFYDPNTAAWVQTLDKTTPISNSQCAVYVPNPFDHGTFLCTGGYNTVTSSGTAATEGLVNIGTGIQETPPSTHGFTDLGFAAMANPSKGMISYVTSMSGRVVLKAYDASGRLVETLVNSVQPAGIKTLNWDTSNITNGVYFLKLDAQGETATHKMIIVK